MSPPAPSLLCGVGGLPSLWALGGGPGLLEALCAPGQSQLSTEPATSTISNPSQRAFHLSLPEAAVQPRPFLGLSACPGLGSGD